MGTTLTGLQIDASYCGLIKTGDNAGITATPKQLSDGLGNDACIAVGTASTVFTGTADFTGATVTGLPTGAAGLVNGTGADSLKNADSLVTNPATATGAGSIALGDGATSTGDQNTIIGCSALSRVLNKGGSAFGSGTCVDDGAVAVGRNSKATGVQSIAIGGECNLFSTNGTVASSTGSIAIGRGASATADSAVAIGQNVAATIADTVSVKALEVQTDSTPTAGGIIMSDAGGTDRRINIDATGALQIDSTPVGGGAAGLVSGTGTDSMQSDASLTTVAANAAQQDSIAIGCGAQTPGTVGAGGIAIGKGACIGNYDGTAVGYNATSSTNGQVFGVASCVTGNQGVALGFNACAAAAATALGHQADALAASSIAIGGGCTSSSSTCSIAIGCSASTTVIYSIAIGTGACARVQDGAIAIGGNANAGLGAGTGHAIAIGQDTQANGPREIAIGYNAWSRDDGAVTVGGNALNDGGEAVAIGGSSIVNTAGQCGIAIGYTAAAGTPLVGACSIAIGCGATSTVDDAVALGAGITAATSGTVSVKALETQTASTPTAGGIIMTDAGSTARRLNIDASGALQIDSTPVGGGGDTPAMSIRELPQFAINNFGVSGSDFSASRTWVSATGYATTNIGANTFSDTDIAFAVFSMQPGEVIEGIEFGVSTAGGAGAVVNIGIYELVYRTWTGVGGDQPSGVVLGDKLKDFGSFAATTTGQKTINVSASPFTMPTNSKYGAIALAFSTNDPTTKITAWSQAVWDTYTSLNVSGTSYRMLQPFAKDATTGGALPANLAGNSIEYNTETSNPVWAFIQTKN